VGALGCPAGAGGPTELPGLRGRVDHRSLLTAARGRRPRRRPATGCAWTSKEARRWRPTPRSLWAAHCARPACCPPAAGGVRELFHGPTPARVLLPFHRPAAW